MNQNLDIAQFLFVERLEKLPYVNKIILYGSRARGDYSERSDIDLAIECPLATEEEWLTILDIIANANTLLKIDCVRFDTLAENNPLKTSIMRDGVILFQRDKHEPLSS